MKPPSKADDRIHVLKHSDIRWAFDKRDPYLLLQTDRFPHSETVDPFPCYSHVEQLVRDEIAYVESKVTLKWWPRWFMLPYETLGRTNGWASKNECYGDNDTRPLCPYIVLAGKRIPVAPAMTRYLVAHEFGHTIHHNIEHLAGLKDNEFDDNYADWRGIPRNNDYGGGLWHRNVGEVIANDIRVSVFQREVEFWPHECERPGPRIAEFWENELRKLAETVNAPVPAPLKEAA